MKEQIGLIVGKLLQAIAQNPGKALAAGAAAVGLTAYLARGKPRQDQQRPRSS